MCEPATITAATLAISAASAAASYYTGTQNAKAQVRAIEDSSALQQQDAQRQQEQQREAAAAQMNEHARKAFKDAALFDAVTGEYGGGKSTDRASAIGDIQSNEQLATITKNASLGLQESAFQASAMQSQAYAKMGTVQRPSLIGTGLQLASAGLNYQTGMNKIEADKARLTKPA